MVPERRKNARPVAVEGREPNMAASAETPIHGRPQTNPQLAARLTADVTNPDGVRKALDDAAGMSRNLWLAFLSFGTFLAIAVGSVTHTDLFLNNIRVPLLNVNSSLVIFFCVAPLLFIAFHAYLLLNLMLMVDSVRSYMEDTDVEPKDDNDFPLLLTIFPFVELLAGTSYSRRGNWLPGMVVWITVVFAPLVVLLLMQLQFLPYHSQSVTWGHRIVIGLDLALLWLFWPRIVGPPGAQTRIWDTIVRSLALVATVMILIFATGIATFPGEPLDNIIGATAWIPSPAKLDASTDNERANGAAWTVNLVSPYELFFLGAINEVTGSRNSLWSNTIVVPDEDFVDDAKLDTMDRTISLRGRDLRGAVLVRTDLRKADFTGAVLDDADLSGGRFDQAYFYCAREDKTQRTGCTSLLNAKLDDASLRGAELHYAHLEGASFRRAKLHLANLTGAHLQAATLDAAQLHHANLLNSDLRGASLKRAQLYGADLRGTHLEGASLASAVVWHAKHEKSVIDLCDLRSLIQDRASLDDKGQAVKLDAGRVIEAATKDTSRGLAAILKKDLASLLGAGAEEGEELDLWQGPSGGQAVSDEMCLQELADFIVKLGCDPKDAPFVARGLIIDRVQDLGPFAEMIETKFLDEKSCPGAAGLTSAEKRSLHEQASSAADQKRD